MNYPLVEQTIRPNITGHLKIKYAVTNCIFDILHTAFDNLYWRDAYCNCEISNINVSIEAIAS